jgi:hypothetical protein
MDDEHLDRLLSEMPPPVSPGFGARVLRAVRRAAPQVAPISFPWRRLAVTALPACAAGVAGLILLPGGESLTARLGDVAASSAAGGLLWAGMSVGVSFVVVGAAEWIETG